MKNLLTLLVLVIVTVTKAQVYCLEYTTFQLYDTSQSKFHKETPVGVVAIIDMDNKTFGLVNKQQLFFDVDIKDVKMEKNQYSYTCVNPVNKQLWNLHVSSTRFYRILRGSSGKESWVYRVKIKNS